MSAVEARREHLKIAPYSANGVDRESKNIVQPEDWWTAFEVAAEYAGLSLSDWIAGCVTGFVPEPAFARKIGCRKAKATLRKNISLPRAAWPRVFSESARREISASEWVGLCCCYALPDRIVEGLSKRAKVGGFKTSAKAKTESGKSQKK